MKIKYEEEIKGIREKNRLLKENIINEQKEKNDVKEQFNTWAKKVKDYQKAKDAQYKE